MTATERGLFALVLLAACATSPRAKEPIMPKRAHGTFEVKLSPLPAEPIEPTFGKVALEKSMHGDLDGTTRGVLIGSGEPKDGAAGYVALERFTGTLHGRRGSFVLQHSGSMSGGVFALDVRVVPGSGTDELAGLAGKMIIHIVDGNHSYDFDYEL